MEEATNIPTLNSSSLAASLRMNFGSVLSAHLEVASLSIALCAPKALACVGPAMIHCELVPAVI